MLDTDFNDFLNSDDDEFFVEASNSFLDCDRISTESVHGPKKYASKKCEQNINSSYSELEESPSLLETPNTNSFLDCDRISTGSVLGPKKCEQNINSGYSELEESPSLLEIPNTNIHLDCNKTSSDVHDSISESAKIIATSSVKSDSCNIVSAVNKNAFTPNNSYINSRFTPGFTPKAKKRKFAGPAGLLECLDESNDENPDVGVSDKVPTLDIDFEHIASSQFSPELLSLTSWQKLQSAVSSCSSLHSAAKYYSIQRVLNESSKKKMPKHMIVPVLCVLVKKINKESSAISVFMDDTGEINGKIDAEVFSKYKECIVEGAALILKKITFLCNVLILKGQNIVSVYMPDGTEKHLQNLESSFESSEPLKPINCECIKLSHQNLRNNNSSISHHSGVGIYHKADCVSQSQTRDSFNQRTTINKSVSNSTVSQSVPNSTTRENASNCTPYKSVINTTVNKIISNATVNKASNSVIISSVNKESTQVETMRDDAFLEDLLSEDNCMDEFDELLGNLDEKSFLEE